MSDEYRRGALIKALLVVMGSKIRENSAIYVEYVFRLLKFELMLELKLRIKKICLESDLIP